MRALTRAERRRLAVHMGKVVDGFAGLAGEYRALGMLPEGHELGLMVHADGGGVDVEVFTANIVAAAAQLATDMCENSGDHAGLVIVDGDGSITEITEDGVTVDQDDDAA